jgi:predicted ATPase
MASTLPLRAVITGGPGAGKSTLLSALAQEGFQTFPEVARGLLQKAGGMALRAERPAKFAIAMLEAERDAWFAAPEGTSVYDRGFPDIAGFLELESIALSRAVEEACRNLRYSGPIFRAPPWRAIYTQDEERFQSWDQATLSDQAVSAAWLRYGYELVVLPLASVAERVQFVRDRLGA